MLTGKGGVGKSTVAAALAVAAADRGLRPLVVELGHRATMRSIFGVDAIGFRPRAVGHGVHAMSVEVDQAVVEYVGEHIPSRRIARAVVSNQVIERLFSAMPAVGEIATVNTLRRLEAERDDEHGRPRPRWAPLIVDLDATGHALMFLELRQVVAHLMGAGPMRRLLDEMAALFADPRRTRLNLVTLPDALPVSETLQLHERLATTGSATLGRVFVNRVPDTGLVDAESAVERLCEAAEAAGEVGVLDDARFARAALRTERHARAQIDRLRHGLGVPIVELPRLGAGRLDVAALRTLGTAVLAPPQEAT